MPIEISCTSCSKRLRVPDNAAGKRVKCPQCQTVLSVPAAGAASTPSGSKTASGSGKSAAENYHLKTEDGQTFGPVPKQELDSWLAEGRITAECQVLKEGADQWQWASDLYPQLNGGGAASGSESGFPNVAVGGGGGGASDNPFDFASKSTGSASSRVGGRGSVTKSHSTASGAGVEGLSDKSKIVAGLLCLFLGAYGVGRFYLGYTGLGVAQLLTCGGCGVWSIIDAITCFTGKMRDAQGRPLRD